MNARPLGYHSRLTVDSVSIECLRCVVQKKMASLLSQKSTVSFAADATIFRFVLKNENCLNHLSSSSKLANPLFLNSCL